MTTQELQKELETRARSIKERANGAPWGEKEIKFFRGVYSYTLEYEKKCKELEMLRQKLNKLHELTTLYHHAFSILSGAKDLPIRSDQPTPIGVLVLMKLTSLSPDSLEMTILKRFIYNAFNPARHSPTTNYGTFGNYEAAKLAEFSNHSKNES